jgi:subtilase family serine protease
VGYNPADVTKYFDTYGPPLTTMVTPVSTDGTPAICTTCDDAEQALDIEFSISMAPGLDECIVYVGSSDQPIFNAMITDNTAKVLSCSWSWMPADHNIDAPLFAEMAAQGQTYASASGDSSSWGAGEFVWPQESSDVLCVGGTHLVTTGPAGGWVSETGWSDSGGGIAIDQVRIPSWQQSRRVVNHDNHASKSHRNGPDVSMEGDFQNYICYNNTCSGGWGGTSFSAPEFVGYLALANEQATSHGHSSLGFVNETLYKIAIKGDYASNFHDITSGTNFGFTCVMGFDLVTGWGTPNGDTLINTLAP